MAMIAHKKFSQQKNIVRIAFSPVENKFAASSLDARNTTICDIDTEKHVTLLTVGARSLQYCHQGCCLSTVFQDCHVYDTKNSLKKYYKTQSWSLSCGSTFTTDHEFFAHAGRSISIVDAKNWKNLFTIEENGVILEIKFISNQDLLYFANNGVLNYWNVVKKSPIHSIKLSSGLFTDVYFSLDNQRLVATTMINEFKCYKIENGKLEAQVCVGKKSLTNVRFLGNKYIISADSTQEICIWNTDGSKIRTMQQIQSRRVAQLPTIIDIGAHPSLRYFAVENDQNFIGFYYFLNYKLMEVVSKLLRKVNVTTYVIIDVINFIFARQYGGNFQDESEFYCYEKLTCVQHTLVPKSL